MAAGAAQSQLFFRQPKPTNATGLFQLELRAKEASSNTVYEYIAAFAFELKIGLKCATSTSVSTSGTIFPSEPFVLLIHTCGQGIAQEHMIFKTYFDSYTPKYSSGSKDGYSLGHLCNSTSPPFVSQAAEPVMHGL